MAAKKFIALIILGAFSHVDAFWRMECRGSTGLARIDPIVDFNKVSTHVHAIHGSSGFGLGATFDDLRSGNCSSCAVKQDLSAYWAPAMYFHDSDKNTYEPVSEVGGMLAYYLLRGDNITAFPAGFQMISGSNTRRDYTVGDPNSPDPPKSDWVFLQQTSQDDLAQRAIGFNCLDYKKQPEGALFRHYLPDKAFTDANCPDGLRLEVMFPSCWNGETNSEDHQTHVAYPNLVGEGDCPESHPRKLVTMFFETIWDTGSSQFKGRNGEFVLSNGDETGFGYHGDFMTGWDPVFLQEAIDTCQNPSGELFDCPLFMNNGPLQSEDEQRQCKFEMPDILANEDCAAKDLVLLPGDLKAGDIPNDLTADPVGEPTSVLEDKPTSVADAPVIESPAETTPVAPAPGGAFLESSSAPVASTPDINVLSVPQASTDSSIPAPPPPAPPATTAAPSVSSDPGVVYEVVSTQTTTLGAQVEEIVWVEPVVYITEPIANTVGDPAPVVKKSEHDMKLRRDHQHAHRHRHLGRSS